MRTELSSTDKQFQSRIADHPTRYALADGEGEASLPQSIFAVLLNRLDMAIKLTYYMDMKVANIAQFKNNLSKLIARVEQGETIEICKRNIPIAYLVPVAAKEKKNHTKLGCGRGSIKIKTDLTQPMIPEETWEMLQI